MTDFRWRVVNIEDFYRNLPCCIYLPMQYMNENVTTEEWGLLNRRAGIKSLNHTMLFAYKVSATIFLSSFSLLVLFLQLTSFLLSQLLATLNWTYIAIDSLVEKGETYENKFFKDIEEFNKSEKQRKKLHEDVEGSQRG